MSLQISDFEAFSFESHTRDGVLISHQVYRCGQGPSIILIQELPGIGVETLALAKALIDAGFEVVLPHLLGPLGQTRLVGNLARVMCMRREFHLFARKQTSPVVDWLRALSRHVMSEHAAGVGVIGMCLTGNFAISLMAEPNVLAAVSAQPSLPVHSKHALHMSEQDVDTIKREIDRKGPMKAFRFEKDKLCRDERFACLAKTFNEPGKERIELNVLPGPGHAVFTLDFVDQAGHPTREALDRVIEYFTSRLR